MLPSSQATNAKPAVWMKSAIPNSAGATESQRVSVGSDKVWGDASKRAV